MTKPVDHEDDRSQREEGREVLIPHAVDFTPVTAVKNRLLLASLDQLKKGGLYERYAAAVAPGVPEQIRASLAMNWAPVELALAHYQACDNMLLGAEAAQDIGARVGAHVQGTSLVSAAKKAQESRVELWAALPAIHRMWARYYQGGSAQIVKLGPMAMQVELRGYVLHKFRYFRNGQLAVVSASLTAVGTQLTSAKIASYSAGRDELALRFTWA
ncbi:MAG: hypothetical protein RLZZ450_925 [Pseudomonadota bacterium]|jgi:hypothetical protein